MLHILGGVLGQFPPPAKYTLPMSADFPYRGDKESQWPLCNGIPRQIHDQQQKMGPVTAQDVLVKCRVSECIKISAMWLHVATHILRRRCGTASSLLPSPDEACGFCGLMHSVSCATSLGKGSTKATMILNLPTLLLTRCPTDLQRKDQMPIHVLTDQHRVQPVLYLMYLMRMSGATTG